MRKDVKIGLGIGGVLLAVLIVYALVPKNDTSNKYVQTDTTKPAEDDVPPPAPNGGQTTGGETPAPPARETIPPVNNGTLTDNVGPRDTAAQETAQATTPKVDWDQILNSGIVPDEAKVAMVARNDVFGDGTSNSGPEPKWDTPSHGTPQAGSNTQTASGTHDAQGSQARPRTAEAKLPAASKGMTEHTVQQGENLSMIAAVAYGDARKHTEILKANPGLDPRKLRPGMVIKMPDASTFASATPAAAQLAKTPAKVDPKSEYEVQQDDNLSRISSKLYGTTAKSKSIYELNKDKIGADPGKLKLGTVLKLPEPPTVQQAAR